MYMDYYQKYVKYKKKYIELKQQSGGSFSANRVIPPLQKVNVDVSKATLIGQGGFGIVVKTEEKEPIAVKLITDANTCTTSDEERNIQNELSDALIELQSLIPKDLEKLYNLLYIPKPFAHQINVDKYTLPDGEIKDIKCSYAMEYMTPIDIEVNKFKDTLVQLHIALYEGHKGFPSVNERRGYMMGKLEDFDWILGEVQKKHPQFQYTKNEIMKSVGLLFGSAVFGAHYIPKDFQTMLSIYNNQIKLVNFDFDFYKKFDMNTLTRDDIGTIGYLISECITRSPYIMSIIDTDEDLANEFWAGIVIILKIACRQKLKETNVKVTDLNELKLFERIYYFATIPNEYEKISEEIKEGIIKQL